MAFSGQVSSTSPQPLAAVWPSLTKRADHSILAPMQTSGGTAYSSRSVASICLFYIQARRHIIYGETAREIKYGNPWQLRFVHVLIHSICVPTSFCLGASTLLENHHRRREPSIRLPVCTLIKSSAVIIVRQCTTRGSWVLNRSTNRGDGILPHRFCEVLFFLGVVDKNTKWV